MKVEKNERPKENKNPKSTKKSRNLSTFISFVA